MGKASRRKHADQQQRQYFDIKGDARSAADRANARAMLDTLQQKLVDDALREDGFYFMNGKYTDARRPRFTPGMKTQTLAGHARRITQVAVVPMQHHASTEPDLNSFVVTFGTDCVCVWNMKTGERLGMVDVLPLSAVSICGAATLVSQAPLLWVGFATHLHPRLVVWDTTAASGLQLRDESASLWDFRFGHQQQITCMAFSHSNRKVLVTGSLDSTCIIWNVSATAICAPQLTMIAVLPVANGGVTDCAVSHDDSELVACGGDGTMKVWSIDFDVPNTAPLQQQREDWSFATSFNFDIARMRDMLVFDDFLPSFHGNDEWNIHEYRACLSKVDKLPMPFSLAGPATLEVPSLLKEDTAQENSGNGQFTGTASGVADATPNQALDDTVSEVERLRREYETMESFDFASLLNPAAPLAHAFSGESGVKTVDWPLMDPSANGRLLRTFLRTNTNGDYAGHTSHVNNCAVAKEADLVVSVSFDKSIVCWSYSNGVVRSITREAHAAAITSCALTSPTTSQPSNLELLLATAGKDNFVKVWRFKTLANCNLELVYSLAGHYDAITTLCFDTSGVFLLSAGDDAAAHCWRVRPAQPDAPCQPIVTTIDRFAITIQWKVPLANGSALTKYIVRTEQLSSLTSDGSDIKKVKDREIDIKYKIVTVDSLQPGIQYRLCVAAVNAVGQSRWSEHTEIVETLAFAPSKIEKAVLYRDITPTSVRLSWTAPCANGAKISSYTVKSLPENYLFVPAMETPVPIESLSIVTPEPDISRRKPPTKLKTRHPATNKSDTGPVQYEYVHYGLWPGEVYQFIVAAENRCGLGDFSPFSDYIKMESTAPDSPEKPQLASVGKRHVEVTWVKPRSNGSEILQYVIEWTQDNNIEMDDGIPAKLRPSVTILTKSIVGTTYKITDLRPGRPLQVRIAATNLVNGKLTASAFSEPTDFVCTLPDVPDTPVRPRLESPSPHSIVVAVDPPCDNGASIMLYHIALSFEEIQFGILTKTLVREVALRPEDFETATAQPTGEVTLRYKICKLRAKMFYSATVTATNSLGDSKLSESSVPVSTKPPTLPATLPSSPVIRDIEPTQAIISWFKPDHDGGAPLASFVLQYSINDGPFEHEIVVFEGSELVLEHLKPRTSYAFRVAATNAVGRAVLSPSCTPFTTPSLVDYTIATYFASRPPIEHANATVLQRRYRLWKRRARERRGFLEQLTNVLATSWHLL